MLYARDAQVWGLAGARCGMIEGRQRPGELLSELALAAEYDVSRTPVRGGAQAAAK
ncbi:GntR family transcriptional regulator [Saccharopolyspora sp. NPDC000995]